MTKLLAYHGSQHKKFNFNENKVLYLTTDKEKAISYAKREWDEGLIEGEIPVVYTFEVSIENPYRTKGTEKEFFNFCDSEMNEYGKEDLIEKGYDSIIHNDLIGVFYPNQVEFKELQILPKSHEYYYTNDDGIDPNDVDDYYYDGEELNESVKIINNENIPTKFTSSVYDMAKYIENNKNIRIVYDTINKWYFFNSSLEEVHAQILDDAISAGYYPNETANGDEILFGGNNGEFITLLIESERNLQDAEFDGYNYGYVYNNFIIYDRFGEYREMKLCQILGKPKKIINLKKELNESVEEKILYIIRGVPGSGKSTLAHKLTDNVVEADQFFYDDEGNYNWRADKLHWVHKQCFETVKKYMEEGRDKIAVANTFVKIKDYKNYVELAEQFGYKVDIRVCNGNYKSIHNVPEETIEKMKRKFQLDESIAYASKKDLSDVILKNPTRKELRDNNLVQCRCMEDSEGNWYFADMENMLHRYMVVALSDEAYFPLFDGNDCYGIAYYDSESNEFWYNLNDYMYRQECIEQYKNSEYLSTTFPNARIIPNPWNNQVYDELYDDEEQLNESINDKPKVGDLYVCKIGDETYQRSLWKITAISDDKEFYTITRIENPNPNNKAYLSVNKITLPKWFEKYKDYQGDDTQLDESINDKPKVGDIYELQITENKGQLFEVTKKLPNNFYEVTSLTRSKGQPLGYVEYLEISEKNLLNWFRRYDDYKYEGDDTQLDESKINKEINVKDYRNRLIGIELEPNERFGKCKIVDVYSVYMFNGWENLFRIEEEDTGEQIMVTLDEMKDIFHFDIEKYDTDGYYNGADTELDESEQKVWPDGSMFTASDGIWQIYSNNGEDYELKQYRNDGITIKWKLSMKGFPPKGLVPCKNNDYNGDDTVLDESIILKEGIEEVKKYYKNIPDDMFQTLVDLDPTYQGGNVLGKFGKWILNLYNKKLLKDEDFYKVTEYLITFKDNLSKMPNKDIMSYKTLPDLAKAIQPFEGQKDVSNKQKSRDAKKGGKKILETNEWLVISPKTEEASCYYGANTKWCTAAKNDNMFDAYNRDGPLYIFINKINGKKYQMHAQSLSFMNELDEPVPPFIFIKDKKVQKLIEDIIDHEKDEINWYDDNGSVIYGLNWGDSEAFIATGIFNFTAALFSMTKKTYEMSDVLAYYLENKEPDIDNIEELYCKYNDLDMSTNEIRKACESLKTTNNAEFNDVMSEIMQTIMNQINEASPYYKIYDIKYREDYDELRLYVKTVDGLEDYMDIVLRWFLYNDGELEGNHILDEIGSYIKNPKTNFNKITKMFCDFIKELVDEQKELKSMKESIIKNPSIEDIQQMLKEQDLGFTFNPIKNDLTIYKDISFLKESNDISGILSPKVAEVKTDDEEYTRKALSNTLKKIYPSGYQLIIY